MGSISELHRPTVEAGASKLFQSIEQRFQSTSLGSNRWYLLAISALVGGGGPDLADQLYLYLINLPQYSTSSSRKALIRRIREALVKDVSIIGVCKPLEAIFAINRVEREEDKDHTFTREHWQCDEANHNRGMNWMSSLYSRNTSGTLDMCKDHPDFGWISSEITYGLYLSDRTVLDDLDTQMVVLPGIMIQNLRTETHWHIRGTRRIGVSREDVEVVWDCVEMVAAFLGTRLDKVPAVADVEYDI